MCSKSLLPCSSLCWRSYTHSFSSPSFFHCFYHEKVCVAECPEYDDLIVCLLNCIYHDHVYVAECPETCPDYDDPICGSDGKTYFCHCNLRMVIYFLIGTLVEMNQEHNLQFHLSRQIAASPRKSQRSTMAHAVSFFLTSVKFYCPFDRIKGSLCSVIFICLNFLDQHRFQHSHEDYKLNHNHHC